MGWRSGAPQERQSALTIWAPGPLGSAMASLRATSLRATSLRATSLRATSLRATSLRAVEEALVPANRAAEALVQGVGRAPAEPFAGLARVEPLDRDLAGRDVLHHGGQRRAHQRDDQVHQVQDRELGVVREVERLAAQLWSGRKLLGQQDVGRRTVLNVEVVADVLPVRADDRALAPDDRANRARDEAAPVEVATAVEVAASRDRHGEL